MQILAIYPSMSQCSAVGYPCTWKGFEQHLLYLTCGGQVENKTLFSLEHSWLLAGVTVYDPQLSGKEL